MATETTLKIRPQTEDNALYCKYGGQTCRQGAYLSLDCDTGELRCDYNAELGNAVPFTVWHNRTLRWTIPPLRADAANELMDEVADECRQILAGYECEWDGRNHVGKFTPAAESSMDAVQRTIDANEPWHESQVWEPQEAGDWYGVLGFEALRREYGITAQTTDEELKQIAAEADADQDCCEITGTLEFFTQARDRARDDED